MGDLIPLRRGTLSAPAEVAEAINLAFRKAATEAVRGNALVARDAACSILLKAIVDQVGRGTRDVERLCEAALAKLREAECRCIGRAKPS